MGSSKHNSVKLNKFITGRCEKTPSVRTKVNKGSSPTMGLLRVTLDSNNLKFNETDFNSPTLSTMFVC